MGMKWAETGGRVQIWMLAGLCAALLDLRPVPATAGLLGGGRAGVVGRTSGQRSARKPVQLQLRQRLEFAELLTGYEMPNRYDVFDGAGRPLMVLRERGGGFWGWLGRLWLGSGRPMSVDAHEVGTNQRLYRFRRPFTLFRSVVRVEDASGRALGRVQQSFPWFVPLLNRRFSVRDASDREVAVVRYRVVRVLGIPLPDLRWWRYTVLGPDQGGGRRREVIGELNKEWDLRPGGIARELFTDADTLSLRLESLSRDLLPPFLGALLATDLTHFEETRDTPDLDFDFGD